MKLGRYYYKFQQEPYAYGPFPAKNEREARQHIRDLWHLNTLHGVEVWEE